MAVLFLFFISASFLIWGQENPLAGPLYGKNYYLPHLPVYSFPGFSPESGEKGALSVSFSYTGFNEFTAADLDHRVLDYEGSVFDFSFNCRPGKNLLLGVDTRIISYYGGAFDPLIEGWHNFWGFPNGGREYFPGNDVFINIENSTGRDIRFSSSLAGLGDTDLYALWTFYTDPIFTLAAAGILKLPTGSISSGTGSDFFDTGGQLLLSWHIHSQWDFHFQQGFVIPGDLWFPSGENYASLVSSQTFLAIQYMPRSDWSFILQGRINTSPISSEQLRYTSLWGITPLFTLPQTSIQAGIKKVWKNLICQIYIEEDPLTYEGLDILLSLRITRFLNP